MERVFEDVAGLPDDVLSTLPKQTGQRSEADNESDAVDKSDAEVDDKADSISTGASNRKRPASVSAVYQINDNNPTENSDTEEAHSAQTRIIRP